MPDESPDYRSYLLRLWRADDEVGAVWRASLEWPDTRNRQNFATLDDLFAFLREEADVPPAGGVSTKNVEI